MDGMDAAIISYRGGSRMIAPELRQIAPDCARLRRIVLVSTIRAKLDDFKNPVKSLESESS
jgi:hypothetical protein